eukprot:UC1_evm1s506
MLSFTTTLTVSKRSFWANSPAIYTLCAPDENGRRIPSASLFLKIDFVDLVHQDETSTLQREHKKRRASRKKGGGATRMELLGVEALDTSFREFSKLSEEAEAAQTKVARAIKEFGTQVKADNRLSFIDAAQAFLRLLKKSKFGFTIAIEHEVCWVKLSSTEGGSKEVAVASDAPAPSATLVKSCELMEAVGRAVLELYSVESRVAEPMHQIIRHLKPLQESLGAHAGALDKKGLRHATAAFKGNFTKVRRVPSNLQTTVESMREEYIVVRTIMTTRRRTSLMY